MMAGERADEIDGVELDGEIFFFEERVFVG